MGNSRPYLYCLQDGLYFYLTKEQREVVDVTHRWGQG